MELPLLPAGKFKLHSVISSHDLGVYSQADWIHGVAIPFAGAQAVEILEVSPVD